ncbi:RNA-binding domain-containing protein [Atractiella rhizophila]|nr:RNA-binding domain-containing protein [Atractiella rhizophila]
MMLPNGMSKGCGVVEYATYDEAQRAIKELNDKTLMGRQIFIREDREEEPRYGAAAVAGRAGYNGPGAFGGRGGYGGFGGGYGGHAAHNPFAGKQLFVSGLPPNVGWQDLKDLFRAAGSIMRADINFYPDGTPKGTGTVGFETERDAANAIAMYHGFEFQNRKLEVHYDRFAGPPTGYPPRGGFGGRGGFRGRGGFGGGPGRFNAQDVYADYTGPDQNVGGQSDGGGFGGGPFGGGFGGPKRPFQPPAPSTQIFVKNLPWSTSNEDLVELFQTTGKVEHAEVIYEGGRSKGTGVVQFATIEEAETAISKFQSYQYGGVSLPQSSFSLLITRRPTSRIGI